MTGPALLDAETACARLGVDRFGLDALIRTGELSPAPGSEPDRFAETDIAALQAQRQQRREEALERLARLDGPHLQPSGCVFQPAPPPELRLEPPSAAPAVLLDANVLVGALRRHLMLALAEAGLIRPRWSDHILFETGHAHARITAEKPGRDGAGEAAQIITALEACYPEATVPRDAVDAVIIEDRLPDPDDAHVIQAAAAGQAKFILTENMKDFPRAPLKRLGLYARPPGEFLASLLGREPERTRAAFARVAARLGLDPAGFAKALQSARLGGVARKLEG